MLSFEMVRYKMWLLCQVGFTYDISIPKDRYKGNLDEYDNSVLMQSNFAEGIEDEEKWCG